MIIIEGCDNSGKSTLAARLAKDLGVPVIHSTRPDLNSKPEELLKHSQSQLIPAAVILDRIFAISEYVYGRVLRGGSLLKDKQVDALMDLHYRKHLIIYCRPKDATIRDNRGRDQMDGVLDHMPQLIAEYDYLMSELDRTGATIIEYDYQGRGYPNLVKKCFDHFKEYETRYTTANFLTFYRGEVI